VSGSAIPIFYEDVPMSVRASMLFPADPDKARLVVGWAMAKTPQVSAGRSKDDLVLIASDAAAFDLRDEVVQRGVAGSAVGEVIKALFMMVSNDADRPVASIKSAIRVFEDAVVDAGGQVGASRVHEYLGLLQPALHLWAAWSDVNRRWPVTQDEANEFIERAEIIREQLVNWNVDRADGAAHSQHLSSEFLQPYQGWRPTGLKLYPSRLRRADVPVRGKPGRRPQPRPAKRG
jgi:hypothetical protein